MSDDNVVILGSRNGNAGKPRSGNDRVAGKTLMEQNAPNFTKPEEFEAWLDGKASRREIREDILRIHNNLVVIHGMAERTANNLESILRVLSEREMITGVELVKDEVDTLNDSLSIAKSTVLDYEEYEQHCKLQLRFKATLDHINHFAPNDKGEINFSLSFKERISIARSWNNEHPDLPIHGDYIIGLREYLSSNPNKLSEDEIYDIRSIFRLFDNEKEEVPNGGIPETGRTKDSN